MKHSLAIPTRRGMALVLVLGLLSLALGAAYALVRTQTVESKLNVNFARNYDARSAARMGLAIALRKLYDNTWPGAEQSISGTMNGGTSGYSVTYTTGDSALTAGDPLYAEYPYRLTLVSSGFSQDSINTNSRSNYKIRAVVKLNCRKLNTNAITTANLEAYSCYQTGNVTATVQHPVRFNGLVMLQGPVDFSPDYPKDKYGSPYQQYFSDLGAMFTNGLGDYRTFGGTVQTPLSRQGVDFDYIRYNMSVPFVDVTASTTSPITPPSSIGSYRLYAKGKLYTPRTLTTNLSTFTWWTYSVPSGTYVEDPITNPLGINVINAKNAGILSDTTIRGCTLNYGSTTSSNLHVSGDNINLQKLNLPRVLGDSNQYCLPTALTHANFYLRGGVNRQLEGLIAAQNEFEIETGFSTAESNMTGTIVSTKLTTGGRMGWSQSTTWWSDQLTAFSEGNTASLSSKNAISTKESKTTASLKLQGSSTTTQGYFPEWLANNQSGWGFHLDPKYRFDPLPSGTKYFSPADWSQPIFVPHSSDGGLMWEVVRWEEPI